MTFSAQYIAEATQILSQLDTATIERMAELIAAVRARGGRIFFLGVGGSAANASHAVNDFRKIVGIEAYAPTDNVAELTARVNDESWESVFVSWLRGSRLSAIDMIFVLSVGGGNLEQNVSPNLVRALEYAVSLGSTICGIVGRDGGYTARVAHACVIVPTVNVRHVTPHAEAFQAVVWHLLVSHPLLQAAETKWGVATLMRPAVFLDRDGVLNRTFVRAGVPHPPDTPDELEILPGVPDALARLADLGLLLVVVTNQPDVARGTQRREVVEAINARLGAALPLDDIVVCYHDTPDGCVCRKPLPGMLLSAAARLGIDRARSFMVGDRWSDIEAGRAAGCTTMLIDMSYSGRARCAPDYLVADLPEAARLIAALAK